MTFKSITLTKLAFHLNLQDVIKADSAFSYEHLPTTTIDNFTPWTRDGRGIAKLLTKLMDMVQVGSISKRFCV